MAVVLLPAIFVEQVQDGECKGTCLAGAGLGCAEDVVTLEGRGDGLYLDGGRVGIALVGDGANDWLDEPEFSELHICFFSVAGAFTDSGEVSGYQGALEIPECQACAKCVRGKQPEWVYGAVVLIVQGAEGEHRLNIP